METTRKSPKSQLLDHRRILRKSTIRGIPIGEDLSALRLLLDLRSLVT